MIHITIPVEEFEPSALSFYLSAIRSRWMTNIFGTSDYLFTLNDADPNRPGMHMKLIKFLLKLKAERIVYVSCNPGTCARDLGYLCHGVVSAILCWWNLLHNWGSTCYNCLMQPEKNIEGCYNLKSVQPVDMFPHTPHIECVCLLDLRWFLSSRLTHHQNTMFSFYSALRLQVCWLLIGIIRI